PPEPAGGPAATGILPPLSEAFGAAVAGGEAGADDGGPPSPPPASTGGADVVVASGTVVVVVLGRVVVDDDASGVGARAGAELGTAGGGGGTAAGGRGGPVVVVGAAVVGGAGGAVVGGGAGAVVVVGGGGGAVVVVVADGSVTSIRPTMLGWMVQWYVYVPAVEKRSSYSPPPGMSPESNDRLPGSDVTVCLFCVLFVQMTRSFTWIWVTGWLKTPAPFGSGLGLSLMVTLAVKAPAGAAVSQRTGPTVATPATPASSTAAHPLRPRTVTPPTRSVRPLVFRRIPAGTSRSGPRCAGRPEAGPGGRAVKDSLKEFKTFVLRGNVVDLAIAVVIGAAFGAVVTALVKDIITPILAIPGKTDFSALTFTIRKSHFLYGDFINTVISFLTIAAAVFFLVVKPLNALMARR